MATRAEHRRTTMLKLSQATTKAYEELGPATTIDDIAARAGVSRRTVFRYVDSKEDLVYIQPTLWLEVFDEALELWRAEHGEATVRRRILYAAHHISEHIEADPEPVRRAMAVALQLPDFARGYAMVTQRWIARIASEVAGDATDEETVFRSRVLGAAIMGVIDAALNEWVVDNNVKLVDVIDRGLDYLAPILPDD